MNSLRFGTNLASWLALCTINAHMEYSLLENWSVELSGRYNGFVYEMKRGEDKVHLMQRSVCVSGKWWARKAFDGWWAGPLVAWQEYDEGGIGRNAVERGTRMGGGVAAGYCFRLGPHVDVDLGLGVWAGTKVYDVYPGPKSLLEGSRGVGAFVLPYDLIVSFNYEF